jgi:phage terminase large subunit
MTTRKGDIGRKQPSDLASGLADRLSARIADKGHSKEFTWPNDRYKNDPVGFAKDILGVGTWARQEDLLEAVRDHDRVAVSAGRKVSKSFSIAILALWWICTREDSLVVLSSTTARQVDEILWTELRRIWSRSGRCLRCKQENYPETPCPHSHVIGGKCGDLARTGLTAGFRRIYGFTARETEAVAGVSGRNLFYIIDEASGVSDAIFDAIFGNLAASGAKLLLCSNPTQCDGEFYRAFHDNSVHWKTLTISSEESPNVVAGKEIIPGLASKSWIDRMGDMWGVDSAKYIINVLGKFVYKDEGKIFSIHDLQMSTERWYEDEGLGDTGRLIIGVDCAGSSGLGDESVFAIRKGKKILSLIPVRGLTPEGHLANILGIIREKRRPQEDLPIVCLDREGPIGGEIWGVVKAYAESNPGIMAVIGFRSSDKAHRQPQYFDRARDELFANLSDWVKKDGGCLPPDEMLQKDLHSLEWKETVTGRQKITPKDEIKKLLGRSPDRGDAVALACWPSEYQILALGDNSHKALMTQAPEKASSRRELDPYGNSRALDPYRR